MNRNNTVGTIFDGYIGASHSCINDTYAGPSEASEPEIQNELWVADTFKNIKFSNNIHSFGGYFMWAPGAYLPDRGEGDLDHANIGVEKYFFEAGDQILNRIKEHRNTAILPERTGPIADVLYSAAGNSADEHWYERDVIAYSFETGADLFYTELSEDVAAGSNAMRIGTGGIAYLKPGDTLRIGVGTGNMETRTVQSVVRPNPQTPAPTVFLTEPFQSPHPEDERVEGSALEYSRDRKGPEVRMTGPKRSTGPIETTFEFVNEPSVIRYTMDGRKPNANSPLWDSTGPREPGEVFHLTETTTFRWIATDIKGNTKSGKETFRIGRGGGDDDDDDDEGDDD